MLPDAYRDVSFRAASHYRLEMPDGSRYFDFDRFRVDFSGLVACDALYLGYYMHLVEDAFYRRFCYVRHRIFFRNDEDVQKLHRDYHLLNAYLVQSRKLSFSLYLPENFAREPIHRVAPFEAEAFLEQLREDFLEHPEGETHFITRELIDDFMEQYLPLAEKELRAVLAGSRFLRAADLAWSTPQWETQ